MSATTANRDKDTVVGTNIVATPVDTDNSNFQTGTNNTTTPEDPNTKASPTV